MRNACYSGPLKPLQFVRDEITSTSTPSCTYQHAILYPVVSGDRIRTRTAAAAAAVDHAKV